MKNAVTSILDNLWSQYRTVPPSATGRGANGLLVTLAMRGNLRHAMQQKTYAFLERKTPELPQGLVMKQFLLRTLKQHSDKGRILYASTSPNYMTCHAERLIAIDSNSSHSLRCSCG